ncbi:hypothetical protein Q4E93_28600 [Flavitalea sp. BT771]|uniref:hypothetical protein n=1 Tax=Flavitalea sp. BT771 TaxID=3063329 RepID=UPI0026E291BE|nr:hypothetical protein [Flavitalea sp. BT771]MDO6434605.1 hypothetical protein [Flavitalea sp. BT771]MDV6223505.1 hypothetical protein [Flavitalea sp. BT771]
MKTEEQIRIRMMEVKSKLKQIDDAIARELERPFFARRPNLCQFLDLQRKIHASLYKELKWLYE